MKKITALLILLLSCPCIYGQDFIPAEVEISTEKVKLPDGRIMYAHRIEKGQTLFSIAKKYGLKVDEILASNPGLDSDNIKTGSIIYIPSSKGGMTSSDNAVMLSEGITAQDSEYNSRFTKGERDAKKTKYKKHRVKWYEDIYSIAKKYDVSVESIVHLNRLSTVEVKKKDILLIPDKNYKIEDTYQIKTDGFIKTEGIGDDTERTEQAGQPSETEKTDEKKARKASKTVFDKNKTYKFSVIMPFNANAGKEFANINFLDFYSGILLAVKDMKESGMKILLEALDMGDYGNSIESIIESGKIDDSYFIIGPPDRNNLKKLATYCNGKKIAVVSPMDANAAFLAHENPFFVQMVPSNYSINRKIIENFAQAADTCTSHLIIYEKGYDNFPMLAEASEYLTKNGIAFETVQYGILEGREILPEIMSKMKISDSVSFSNKVLIASENQAFVSDAVRNMELAEIEGYDIELFGLAKWKGYENIDLNLYHKLELKLVVPYDIDYGNQRTDRFVKDYRALFKADPTPYSFQGYDIASYMLELLFKYDKDYLEELPYVEKTLLQSNVRFTKCHENCGYVNHAYKEIEYMPDYSVIEKTGKNRPYDGSENHAGNDKTITNPSGRDHGIMAD